MEITINKTYTFVSYGDFFLENTTSYPIELHFAPQGVPPQEYAPPHKVIAPLDFFTTEFIPQSLLPVVVWARCRETCEVSIL